MVIFQDDNDNFGRESYIFFRFRGNKEKITKGNSNTNYLWGVIVKNYIVLEINVEVSNYLFSVFGHTKSFKTNKC